MKKIFGVFALAALSLSSCKKDDDKIANRLVGNWQGTEIILYINGVQALSSTDSDDLGYMTFDDCEVKEGVFCNGSGREASSSTSEAFKYQIIDNGNKFIIDEDGDLATTDDRSTFNIDSATSTNLQISVEEVEDGETYKSVIKMKKI